MKISEVPVSWETYAGLRTCWVGDSGSRIRYQDRSPGLVTIEKGAGTVTLTLDEAKALAIALLTGG